MIEITKRIAAPRERVWECLITPELIRAWWGSHVKLHAHPGGRLEERWRNLDGRMVTTRGEITHWQEGESFSMTWADEDWDDNTQLTISLQSRDDGTQLTLRHEGWVWLGAAAANLQDAHRVGWQGHLDDLQQLAEMPATQPA